MSKRANGEGTERQRPDGTWESRYFIHGERKYAYGKTKAIVVQKKLAAFAAAAAGEYIDPSRMTVEQWLRQWEEIYGKPNWRDTTASTHHDSIQNHLVPLLGAIPLQKLAGDDIQRFIVARQKDGAKPATIKKNLSPLKSALHQAVLSQKLVRNPFDAVNFKAAKQKEIQYLTEEEQRLYIAALPDSTAGRALRFMLGTGLRIGEACALRWSDVEKDRFTVRHTAVTVPNPDGDKPKTVQRIHETKTGAGRRCIPLAGELRALLDRQHVAQAEERLRLGPKWKEPDSRDAFVFATQAGTSMETGNLRRAHERIVARAGVTAITPHGLRHSFATRWVAHDSDIRGLSEILGHADVATTLRLYVHSSPAHKAEMMEKMASV